MRTRWSRGKGTFSGRSHFARTAARMLKQKSLNHRRHENVLQNEGYTPRHDKPWSWSRPVRYMLREQRLVFVLVGMIIATSFFLLQPVSWVGRDGRQQTRMPKALIRKLPDVTVEKSVADKQVSLRNPGGKIPLGLKRKPLRVVVTGGAGFVGSHLVDRLMERGDNVIVVDNFFTGRKDNVKHHLGNPRFELVRHDVVEPILLEVDQIYHLACPASPVHYKHNPVKTIKTNVMGTLNMLGLAKRVGARFLLTSTSEVYGDPLEHP
eukprot:c21748_g1_i1 orf=1-792(-)